MTNRDELKRAAAEAAMEFLPPRGLIGLGSGSTSLHAIHLIGERVAGQREGGREAGLVCVATSAASAALAARLGISLLDDEGPWEVAVTFDGADEVSPSLDLIKGGGGALLREKIINSASTLNVIIVDDAKLSDALGEQFRLPVEVTRFGWKQTQQAVEALAGPATRRERGGAPFITDNGNFILDVATGPIADPAALERALETLPGVVVSGLFVGRADVLVVAGTGGVEIRRRYGEKPGG
jgi:ribose 5-phosphate isomerase A